MLQIQNLSRRFGDVQAVDDVSFTVTPGRVTGFVGANGAGKTTTMRMILGVLAPTGGQISWNGEPITADQRRRIGYMPEERGLYPRMKILEQLVYLGRLYGAEAAAAERRAMELLEHFDLAGRKDDLLDSLSLGNQQRVQVAAALIHHPEALVLDEPFSGLDPVNMRMLRDLILDQHARGTTVLFSTHVMHQAEQLCEHIVMLHDGRKVLDDKLSTLRARNAPRALRFSALSEQADVPATLSTLPCVAAIEAVDDHYRIDLNDALRLDEAVQSIAARLAPSRLELIRPTLEDIFIDIVSTGTQQEVGA